jgi:transposase
VGVRIFHWVGSISARAEEPLGWLKIPIQPVRSRQSRDSQITFSLTHGVVGNWEAHAMHRYALRDDQWDRIKDFQPGRDGHVGGTAADNRLFVEAVIYRYRTGIPWRDLPERYGHWKATHRRYRRWCESGVFARVFETLARDADNEFMMLDATIVRAH